MKLNYLLQDIELKSREDINLIYAMKRNSAYKEEVVINLFVENDLILHECLEDIKGFRFGILHRLPLVNLFFNIDNIWMIKSLSNDIQNFITPIVKIDISTDDMMEKIKDILALFKQKGWKLQILFEAKDIEEFEQEIKIYNLIKCEFFEDDICMIFDFSNEKSILKCAYKNMSYVMDTIRFLGMRNNVIVDCLLKALREKEIGISQSFDDLYKDEMEELMKLDVEKHYEKKTLVRETMDDFAMI